MVAEGHRQRGVFECIEISRTQPKLEVIYVLPEAQKPLPYIDFATFTDVVDKRVELRQRFTNFLSNRLATRQVQ